MRFPFPTQHFFGHIEIRRNLKTSKRPFKLKQSNKASFLGAILKKIQIASVRVSMFFYVTKKNVKNQKKKGGCKGESIFVWWDDLQGTCIKLLTDVSGGMVVNWYKFSTTMWVYLCHIGQCVATFSTTLWVYLCHTRQCLQYHQCTPRSHWRHRLYINSI